MTTQTEPSAALLSAPCPSVSSYSSSYSPHHTPIQAHPQSHPHHLHHLHSAAMSPTSSSSSSTSSSPDVVTHTLHSPSSKRKQIDVIDQLYPQQQQAQRHQVHSGCGGCGSCGGSGASRSSGSEGVDSSGGDSSSNPTPEPVDKNQEIEKNSQAASRDALTIAAAAVALTPSLGLRLLTLDDNNTVHTHTRLSVRSQQTSRGPPSTSSSPSPPSTPRQFAQDEDAQDNEQDSDIDGADGSQEFDGNSRRLIDNSGGVADEMWSCFYGCGKTYRKSSGRSIRRHVMSCFRLHWPCGDRLSDAEVSGLISREQDAGHLVTGLRRWRMRQSRRSAGELAEHEKWKCPWECGQFYRSTSSRSIQRHAAICPLRHGAVKEDSDDKKPVIRSFSDNSVTPTDVKPIRIGGEVVDNSSNMSDSEGDLVLSNNKQRPVATFHKRRHQPSPAESTSESNTSTPETYTTSLRNYHQYYNQSDADHVRIKNEQISPLPKDNRYPSAQYNNNNNNYHVQNSSTHDNSQHINRNHRASNHINNNNNNNNNRRHTDEDSFMYNINTNDEQSNNNESNSCDDTYHHHNLHTMDNAKKLDQRYPFSPSSSPPPSNPVNAEDVMSYSANLSTLHEQQKSVVLQLQSLLKVLFARYGMTHPVFSQPWMTTVLLNRLLGDDLGTGDSQSLISDIFSQLSGTNSLVFNPSTLSSMTHDYGSVSSSSSPPPYRLGNALPSSEMFMRSDRALSFPPPLTPDSTSNNGYDSVQPLSSAPRLTYWRSSPTPQLSPASSTSPSSSAAPSDSMSSAYTHHNSDNAPVQPLFTPSVPVQQKSDAHHSIVSSSSSSSTLTPTFVPRHVHGTPGLSSRRQSMALTIDQLTWTCPTIGCSQSYKITSTKSIEKHKLQCGTLLMGTADDDSDHVLAKQEQQYVIKQQYDDNNMTTTHDMRHKHQRLGAYHALLTQSLLLQSEQAAAVSPYPLPPMHSPNMYQQYQSQPQPNRHCSQQTNAPHYLHGRQPAPYIPSHQQSLAVPLAPPSTQHSPQQYSYQLLSTPFTTENTSNVYQPPASPSSYHSSNRANSNQYNHSNNNNINANTMQFSHHNTLWSNNDHSSSSSSTSSHYSA